MMGNQDDTSVDDGNNSASTYGAMTPLPEDYEPADHDVLVGRGNACRNWTGNEKFRQLIDAKLEAYSNADSKLEKSALVTNILCEVRKKSPNGGFIKKDKDTGRWHEVGDFVARERITQCFRDALFDEYRSSNHSKKKRRREQLRQGRQPQPSKATRCKYGIKPKEKSPESPAVPLSDFPAIFSPQNLTQHTTRQDYSGLPNSQTQTRKSEVEIPQVLNRRPSGIPDPLASSDNFPFPLPPSQSSLGLEYPSAGLLRKQQDPARHFMNNEEAYSAHVSGQFQSQSMPLTLLQERVNSQSRNSDHYPRNWFTTDVGGYNGIYANSNPTPSSQPDLLFGNLFNQQEAPVLNSRTLPDSTSSGQQVPEMGPTYFQQNAASPHCTSYNSFDLSLEPTPIAENISRRHLEHRENFHF